LGLVNLAAFISGMWIMVLAVASFLVVVIVPLESFLGPGSTRVEVSLLQAAIAVGAVLGLVIGLSRMKRAYLRFAFKQQ
jgi:uncharacterized protein (DUF58 family)